MFMDLVSIILAILTFIGSIYFIAFLREKDWHRLDWLKYVIMLLTPFTMGYVVNYIIL